MTVQQNRKDSPLFRVDHDHRLSYRQYVQAAIDLPDTDDRWHAACEMLQRSAHGFPAVFASAYAHMAATPTAERIDPREAPFSAFIFVDDPADSNPYGHVVGKWHQDRDKITVSSNDVKDARYQPGAVSLVDLAYFPANWGDDIKFATLWAGPYEVPTHEVPTHQVAPKPTAKEDTATWVNEAIGNAEHVIELMHRAIRDNDQKEHPRHERALLREIADQRRNLADLRRLV